MPKVWVTQYAQTGVDGRGHDVPCPVVPSLKTDVLDISAGAALMAQPLMDACALIGVSSDVAFHLRTTAFATPTAASVTDKRIPANTIVYYAMQQGNPRGLVAAAIAAA